MLRLLGLALLAAGAVALQRRRTQLVSSVTLYGTLGPEGPRWDAEVDARNATARADTAILPRDRVFVEAKFPMELVIAVPQTWAITPRATGSAVATRTGRWELRYRITEPVSMEFDAVAGAGGADFEGSLFVSVMPAVIP